MDEKVLKRIETASYVLLVLLLLSWVTGYTLEKMESKQKREEACRVLLELSDTKAYEKLCQ